jgi:hypothetical protein
MCGPNYRGHKGHKGFYLPPGCIGVFNEHKAPVKKCWLCGSINFTDFPGKRDCNGWIHDSCEQHFEKTLLDIMLSQLKARA